MGTITSSTGLISGMDIENIVKQLIAIESRPKDQVDTRIAENTKRQTALMALQAKVMVVQVSAASFNKSNIFQQKAVTVSNEDIFTATASKFAQEGSYNLTVKQLASSHHFVSGGYNSLDSTVGAGTISFEIGQGQVSRSTLLSTLNGRKGVQLGKIEITDRAGNTSMVDLRTVQTVQDVLDAINYNSKINVTASVSGGRIVIDDNTGGAGNLVVADVQGGRTAQDLGIRANVSSARLSGVDIAQLSKETLLKDLNDGNGVRGLESGLDDIKFQLADGSELAVDLRTKMYELIGGDPSQATTLKSLNSGAGVRGGVFRLTDRNGRSVDINMTDFKARYGSGATLAQLNDYIQEEVGRSYPAGEMNISFAFNGLDHITLSDKSTLELKGANKEQVSQFKVEDLSGGYAAADLGLVQSVKGDTITGSTNFFMQSVGDVMNAVNNNWANQNRLEMAISADGKALRLIDKTSGSGSLEVLAAGENRYAAQDLGLLNLDNGIGRDLVSGLNTVMLRSLNGGSANTDATGDYAGGTLRIQSSSGGGFTEKTFDSNASLNDVIDWINQEVDGVTARVNDIGNGLIIQDTAAGAGALQIEGDLAGYLNVAADGSANTVNSGNLQLQYMSQATLLSAMRQGQGVRLGNIKITDGLGQSATVNLAVDGLKTLGDVMDRINIAKTNVRARINDAGDGILLYDTSAGFDLNAIKVEETSNGNTASDLGLSRQAAKQADGSWILDGSQEFKLNAGGGDSIDDIVTRINAAKMGVKASLVYDGSNYRISFVSEINGRRGNVYLDPGNTTLSTETLSTGRDAIVLLGGSDGGNPLLLSSATNTLTDAIKGVTLDLKAVSEDPVNVEVKQDLGGITTQIKNFVTAFNDVMQAISDNASYDVTTQSKGLLYGVNAVSMIRQTMISLVQRIVPGAGLMDRFNDVGVSFAPMAQETAADANGQNRTYAVAGVTKIAFDESVFQTAFAGDPEGVTNLFLQADTGLGDFVATRLDQMASTTTASSLKTSVESIQNTISLLKDRSTYLQERIDAKEARLYNQFYAMEQALATMQTQQTSISQISSLLGK